MVCSRRVLCVGSEIMAAWAGVFVGISLIVCVCLRACVCVRFCRQFGYFLHAICTGATDKVVEKLILFNEVPREKLDVDGFTADGARSRL